MPVPGRNDPCPCGSGKKYKRCCLGKDQVRSRPAGEPSPLENRATPTLGERLGEFAVGKEFVHHNVLGLALLWGDGRLAPSKKAFERFVFGDDARQVFIPYLIYDLTFPPNQPSIAGLFLERHGPSMTGEERAWLEARRCSVLKPFEVIGVRLDEGLLLKDLWSGQTVWVKERLATHQIAQWDLLVARLAAEPGKPVEMEQGAFLLPQDARQELLEMLRVERKSRRQPDDVTLFRELAPVLTLFWQKYAIFRPLPDMRNMDGDPMVFVTQDFEVLDRPALLSALASDPSMQAGDDAGSYRWVRPDEDGGLITLGHLRIVGGRLVVETNSRKRAGALRRRIERHTGGNAVRFEKSRSQSFKAAMRRHEKTPPQEKDRGGEGVKSLLLASRITNSKDLAPVLASPRGAGAPARRFEGPPSRAAADGHIVRRPQRVAAAPKAPIPGRHARPARAPAKQGTCPQRPAVLEGASPQSP